MAKKTLFELENGKIEYSDDGETKVYLYQDTPFEELTDQQRQEIANDPQMKDFIKYCNAIINEVAKVWLGLVENVMPTFNKVIEKIKETEAEAEKAKKAAEAKKKKKAKKEKSDEQA